jgi:RHS repeat-associated protein
LTDHQGTVRDVVDSDGVLRKHVEYDAFGRITQEEFYAENGLPISAGHAEAVDQLFYYTGQERDDATGLQLHGARWYDPATARWLSEDPIAFDGGDANLYRYVGNSAPNFTDATGTTQAGNPLNNLFGVSKPSASATLSQADQYFTNQRSSRSVNDPLYVAPSFTGPRRPDASETLAQVHNAYFGELYSRSPAGQAAAKAQRDAEYEQYIRTNAGATGAFVGELFYGAQRAESGLTRGLAEPLNIAEDTVGFFTAGDLRTRSLSLQALDARAGSSYLGNVGYVGLEYTKEVSQFNKAATVYKYAADPSLQNARAIQDQGFNAAVELAGVTAGLRTRSAQRTNAQLVQDIAVRAERKIGGTGAVPGTKKHGYAKKLLNRYQDIYGDRGLRAEVSVIDRRVVDYGTSGSVRIDVLEGGILNPSNVYDYKFGRTGLTNSRVNQIRSVGNYPNVPIIEVRP